MKAIFWEFLSKDAIFSAFILSEGSFVLARSGQNVTTILREVVSACCALRSFHEKRRRTLPVLGLSKYSESETTKTQSWWTRGPKVEEASNSCFHANLPDTASYATAVLAFV